jgi:hypothetical protein
MTPSSSTLSDNPLCQTIPFVRQFPLTDNPIVGQSPYVRQPPLSDNPLCQTTPSSDNPLCQMTPSSSTLSDNPLCQTIPFVRQFPLTDNPIVGQSPYVRQSPLSDNPIVGQSPLSDNPIVPLLRWIRSSSTVDPFLFSGGSVPLLQWIRSSSKVDPFLFYSGSNTVDPELSKRPVSLISSFGSCYLRHFNPDKMTCFGSKDTNYQLPKKSTPLPAFNPIVKQSPPPSPFVR